LKALFVGLFAFCLVTQAAAVTNREQQTEPAQTATQERLAGAYEARLTRKLEAARKYRSTIRFFENRRWLFSSAEHRDTAQAAARRAERLLAQTTRSIAAIRRYLRKREARHTATMAPRIAICDVFGRYCDEALAVARCESHLQTTARNGQYLGLFQMGWYERQLFGHGRTARQQAKAAHAYFVRSGRDWSPWSCKPWFAR
jgi:hypothetical protein